MQCRKYGAFNSEHALPVLLHQAKCQLWNSMTLYLANRQITEQISHKEQATNHWSRFDWVKNCRLWSFWNSKCGCCWWNPNIIYSVRISARDFISVYRVTLITNIHVNCQICSCDLIDTLSLPTERIHGTWILSLNRHIPSLLNCHYLCLYVERRIDTEQIINWGKSILLHKQVYAYVARKTSIFQMLYLVKNWGNELCF